MARNAAPTQTLAEAILARLSAMPGAAASVSSSVEPLEDIAERGRRKALVAAEQAIDQAQTSGEKAAAVGAFEKALRICGLDTNYDKARSAPLVQVLLTPEDITDATSHDSDGHSSGVTQQAAIEGVPETH